MKTKAKNPKLTRIYNESRTRYADFSPCGTYRYTLNIKIPCLLRWVRPALFIMLNPSTADENKNDPTVARCVRFADKHQCTDLTVLNLFALRSTDPRKLKTHKDPIGPLNDEIIDNMILNSRAENGIIVLAWGSHPMAAERGRKLIEKYGSYIKFLCLGKTKNGSPRHPLYVRMDKELEIL